MNIMRAQLPAVADFVNTTFDEFALLNQEEKWAVFQTFLTTLDYGFVLSNIITETLYMDGNQMTHFFDDAPPSKLSREDLQK
ncbi:hypothetical protein COOONC_06547 [Cooperia oncophora]